MNSKTYSSTKKTSKPTTSSSQKRVPSNESVKRSLDINSTPNSMRMSREVGKSPGKIFSFDKNINATTGSSSQTTTNQYSNSIHQQQNGGSLNSIREEGYSTLLKNASA